MAALTLHMEDYGTRLTHADKSPAGDLNRQGRFWRFTAPDKSQGAIRGTEDEAICDALDYWRAKRTSGHTPIPDHLTGLIDGSWV